MAEVDYYENIRQKLNAIKGIGAPKHKKVIEFLQLIWDEDEVKLLNNFEGVGKFASAGKIANKAGMDEKVVTDMLDRIAGKGTIIKFGGKYGMIPFVPGILELYYLKLGDTEENHKKGAKILRELMDKIIPGMSVDSKKMGLLTPKLPYKAKDKLIHINETVESESEVLPHELVEELINKNDYFAALPCQCRLIGEYAGEPCELTKSGEHGCLACGIAAQVLLSMGIGKKITKEQAIEHVKGAAKAGLIHNGANSSGPQAFLMICNCCPCHCGLLSPTAKYGIPGGVAAGSYRPLINTETCTKCETCVKKCPMDAMFHKWPMQADGSDEKMVTFFDKCMGCGVCAANCPENAILMEKVKFDPPPKLADLGLGFLGA